MATWKWNDAEDFINLCIFTDNQLKNVVGRSIHPAAKLMGNALKGAIEGIVVDDGKGYSHHKKGDEKLPKRRGPTTKQKQALIESFGIAEIKRTRYGWNVKCGWDGYNDVKTERWPQGQPNAMIARSVNKGTTFMEAQPFVDNTVRRYTAETEKILKEEFESQLDKIWNK